MRYMEKKKVDYMLTSTDWIIYYYIDLKNDTRSNTVSNIYINWSFNANKILHLDASHRRIVWLTVLRTICTQITEQSLYLSLNFLHSSIALFMFAKIFTLKNKLQNRLWFIWIFYTVYFRVVDNLHLPDNCFRCIFN